MKVVGLDFSLSAPGIVVLDVDSETLAVTSVRYRGYTEVQKLAKADDHFILYKKNMFPNDLLRFDFIAQSVFNFIYREIIETPIEDIGETDEDYYIAIEGYAMKSTGRIFETAEATGITKLRLINNCMVHPHIRIYEPTTIKKFGCLNGSGDKVMMGMAYDESEIGYKIDLSGEHLKSYESPKADIVDAFWIAEMLLTELKLRRGLVSLKGMPLKRIELFNATSKGHKTNLLEREYITRD